MPTTLVVLILAVLCAWSTILLVARKSALDARFPSSLTEYPESRWGFRSPPAESGRPAGLVRISGLLAGLLSLPLSRIRALSAGIRRALSKTTEVPRALRRVFEIDQSSRGRGVRFLRHERVRSSRLRAALPLLAALSLLVPAARAGLEARRESGSVLRERDGGAAEGAAVPGLRAAQWNRESRWDGGRASSLASQRPAGSGRADGSAGLEALAAVALGASARRKKRCRIESCAQSLVVGQSHFCRKHWNMVDPYHRRKLSDALRAALRDGASGSALKNDPRVCAAYALAVDFVERRLAPPSAPCLCPDGLPPLIDCPVHGEHHFPMQRAGGAS